MRPTNWILLPTLLIILHGQEVKAQFQFVTDERLFYSTHKKWVVENFEDASVKRNSTKVFDGPINSLTNNSVFEPGDILENIEIRTLERTSFSNFDTSQFVALGRGVADLRTKFVAVNQSEIGIDKISLYFKNPQTDFGFRVYSIDLRSNTFLIASLMLDVYSDASDENSRIGGAIFNIESPGIMSFAGISSEIPFNRIDLVALTAYASPVIDNLAFPVIDKLAFRGAEPVPEPSTQPLLSSGIAGLIGIGKTKLF